MLSTTGHQDFPSPVAILPYQLLYINITFMLAILYHSTHCPLRCADLCLSTFILCPSLSTGVTPFWLLRVPVYICQLFLFPVWLLPAARCCLVLVSVVISCVCQFMSLYVYVCHLPALSFAIHLFTEPSELLYICSAFLLVTIASSDVSFSATGVLFTEWMCILLFLSC